MRSNVNDRVFFKEELYFLQQQNEVYMSTSDDRTGSRVPVTHNMGWSISLQSPLGVIGLWSSLGGREFYIGYPKQVVKSESEADDLVVEVLNVRHSVAVSQVSETIVSPDYVGALKDFDKPLENVESTRARAFQYVGQRKWTRFYGPRFIGGLGRVWVDTLNLSPDDHEFIVATPKRCDTIVYRRSDCAHISTFPYDFSNRYALDGPTNHPDAIQAYRKNFLQLLCILTEKAGGSDSFSISYALVAVTPDELGELGYQEVTQTTESVSGRFAPKRELVRAKKEHRLGIETIYLHRRNSAVSWQTTRHIPCQSTLSPEEIVGHLAI